MSRSFLLHIPESIGENDSSKRGRPLVIALHGSGANGEAMQTLTLLDSLADAERLLVAYPDGSRGERGLLQSDWNAGTCCGAAASEGIDDVAFILKIIDRISARARVDSRRIYLVGFSDGGRMAYRVACAAPERIAAIGVVAGGLRFPGCRPKASVPLIAFHGTGDSSVPYTEAADTPPINQAGGKLPPSVVVWAELNRCSIPLTEAVSTQVSRHSFRECQGGDVVLYSIAEGQHEWPKSATPTIVSFLLEQSR